MAARSVLARVGGAIAPLLLGACVVIAQPTAEVPRDNWLLPGTSWKLVELNGAPFEANAVATLTEDGRITGQGPCNSFNAAFTGTWPDIAFEPIPRTRRACPDRDAEDAFLAAMERVNRGEMLSDAMLLTGPETSLRLVKIAALPE
ncbi:META domain-containing protein [Amaricoccus sp. W119]|uniref:META domain-containing protein n=1 Tax=Amaricoccus sp. W119 TaxID=3391833 RepID=UPI0039A47F94